MMMDEGDELASGTLLTTNVTPLIKDNSPYWLGKSRNECLQMMAIDTVRYSRR